MHEHGEDNFILKVGNKKEVVHLQGYTKVLTFATRLQRFGQKMFVHSLNVYFILYGKNALFLNFRTCGIT